MNYRLTITAGVAVILASVSEFSLIHGAAWLVETAGAVLIVALAGTLTRLSPVPAGIGATVLAGAASAPLVAAPSPQAKVAAGVLVALCAASTSGLRPLRAIAGLVTYLAALLLFINALLAGAQSLAALIPTSASLHHLMNLARAGFALTKYQPPVDGNSHGVQLLAVAGIGMAAIVVDFIAVRLRKPAVAGLPLLVVYLAPIATTATVGGFGGAIAFLLAAAGYLAMLSSDGRSRLRGWGRVITVWHASGEDDRLGGADVGALTATGRRIGLAAVCAALVVPLVLPTLSPRQILGGGGSGNGPGAPVGLPNPVDQLHGLLTLTRPRLVLTYHTNAPDAGNYLQVYVLNYDSGLSQWDILRPTSSRAVEPAPLQQPPGLSAGTPQIPVTSKITLGNVVAGYNGQVFFLPVPYWPARLSIQGGWREADGTLMIFTDGGNHEGQSYTVRSGEIDPSPAQLAEPQARIPAAIKKEYLPFSSPVNAQLKAIADRVTRGRTSAFGRALALERWFQSGRFLYTLHSPIANSPRGLLAFLTTSRQGYCQQFAFAMAVLARLLGIPSRLAIGYTAGARRPDGTWVVTTRDAHAWPELYFAGVGWVRFEPTPGGPAGQDTAVEPAWVTAAPGNSHQSSNPGQSTGPSTGPSSTARPSIPIRRIQAPQGGTLGPTQHQGTSTTGLIAIAILALLALAAVTPATTRLVARRRRWRVAGDDASLARAAWQELCADLEDYGMACGPSESPRSVARRVTATAGLDDTARLAVGHIATVVERARYAAVPQAAGAIRADVTTVRRSLARSVARPARWRARLAPASTVRPVTAALRHGLGLLTGWMPAAGEGGAS